MIIYTGKCWIFECSMFLAYNLTAGVKIVSEPKCNNFVITRKFTCIKKTSLLKYFREKREKNCVTEKYLNQCHLVKYKLKFTI